MTIAVVTPAGSPPAAGRAAADDAGALVVGAGAGDGVVLVLEAPPLEQAPIAAAAAMNKAGRAKEL